MTGDCHAGIRGSRGLQCLRPPDPASWLLSAEVHSGQPEAGDYARDLSRLPLWLLVLAPAAAFGAMAWWTLRGASSTGASGGVWPLCDWGCR